jgi:uncharacterized protein (TIRG00374 family)
VLKMVYVAQVCQVPRRQVLATIIVAKLQELGGLLGGMIMTTVLLLGRSHSFTRHQTVLLTGMMIALSGLFGLLLYALSGHRQPLVKVVARLARFPLLRQHVLPLQMMMQDVEARIQTTLTQRRGVFLLAQGITCLSTASIFIRPWLFFQAFPDTQVGVEHLCAFFLLTNLINVLSIAPGGLGFFEATMVGYANTAALGDEKGAAFALVSRVADVTFLILGVWLIIHYGLSRVAHHATSEHYLVEPSHPSQGL